MQPLSEELRQAGVELRTWAALHRTGDDSDSGVWAAIVTIDRAANALRRYEKVDA